ncbi:hypothetical protein DM44_6286 [Burkholderia cepacia]|nr:hypothetical protein DM42_5512 [Burkholderia cepacia]KGC01866.1 hypothetical protein DM44_6286 [Burkholderia cepacia]
MLGAQRQGPVTASTATGPVHSTVEAPKPGARTYTSNFTPCASGSWRL